MHRIQGDATGLCYLNTAKGYSPQDDSKDSRWTSDRSSSPEIWAGSVTVQSPPQAFLGATCGTAPSR